MNISLSITQLQQKLRRQELKLARMNNQLDENRVRDTRLKYRLGTLIFLLAWENWDNTMIETKLTDAQDLLNSSEKRNEYQATGETEIRRRESEEIPITALSTKELSEQRRLALNHRVIELGGLMVKHGMDRFPRTAVLGVLMSS